MPRWRPCGTFWRMAERLRAHSTRLILDWPPHRVCIHRSSALRFLHSPLLLIPLRGYPQNRRIRRVALLFSSPRLPLPSSLIFSYSFLSVFVLRFFGNSKRDRDRLAERTGSFTREWSICRAHRVPCFLFSQFYTLGVARELFNLLPPSFFSFFFFCRYFGIKEVSRSNRLAFFSHR